MKIALCLHGYFANAGGLEASRKGFGYIKSKLSAYNIDTFIHSWDLDNKDEVISLYNPTLEKFEQQYSFEEELKQFNQDWFFEGQASPPGMYSTNTIYRGLSFMLSRKRSVDLKKRYEKDNDFKYDCVIIARFDLGQRGKETPQKYYATNFNFSDNLDMQFLYSAFWDQLNHGFADHWFFSSSENIDLLSEMYDGAFEYYQPDSAYANSVTEGWIDSNILDEFSNEMLKDSKSSFLKTHPRWGCIDNHKLYKWHLIVTGLYEKCKFIDITKDYNEEEHNIMHV
jgi:hypothetical protein